MDWLDKDGLISTGYCSSSAQNVRFVHQPLSDTVFHTDCRANRIPAGNSAFPLSQMGTSGNCMMQFVTRPLPRLMHQEADV